MAKVCIICTNEKNGLAVADDQVIRSIRFIKQATGTAKNNELVVCPGCLEAYSKKRADYEKKIALYLVVAAVLFILPTVIPLMSTGFSVYSSILGAVLAVFVMLLPILTSHTPRLVKSAEARAAGPVKARKKPSQPRRKR